MEFFLVAIPGLEDIVQAEVASWFPNLETRKDHGGVTVTAISMPQGLAMNLVLKTPTRILLRVGHFRCRDFPKLFNTVSKMPWRKWIDPGADLSVHASTRLSRLKIKKRIEETCQEAWLEYQKKNKGKKAGKVDLYVRLLNDDCTLSLDTSGQRLHKRGERKHIGDAPLRETIAAAMIQMALLKFPSDERPIEIVDPMMGSGTFLLEAAGLAQVVDKRGFPFEIFAEGPGQTPEIQTRPPSFTKLIGYEADDKTINAAKVNLKALKTPQIHKEDFFKAKPLPETTNKRWLFCNPPYGERIKVKQPLLEYYENLFAASEKVAKPDVAYFLLPAKVVKGKFALPLEWKVIEKRPFLNGGIPVVAFGFARK